MLVGRWQADPAAKWLVLQSWADEFRQKHGRWPSLWVDIMCLEPSSLTVSVACLPVFVSASNALLVLYDETFLTRLWCVVELFAFLVTAARVGGTLDVRRLPPAALSRSTSCGEGARSLSAADMRTIREQLATFDVRFAECSVPNDRDRLLDLVDAYPGGVTNFNRAVHSIFFEHAFGPNPCATEHSSPARSEQHSRSRPSKDKVVPV